MGLEGGRGELQLVRSCTGMSSAQELPPWQGKVRKARFDRKIDYEEVPQPSLRGRLPLPLAQPLCMLCQSSLVHVGGLEGMNISANKSTITKI